MAGVEPLPYDKTGKNFVGCGVPTHLCGSLSGCRDAIPDNTVCLEIMYKNRAESYNILQIVMLNFQFVLEMHIQKVYNYTR